MTEEDFAKLAGRTLMVGFEGTRLDAATAAVLREIGPGGVILFKRNLDSPEILVRLVMEIVDLLPEPVLMGLDQEGGRVSRLEPWIGPTPTASALAGAGGQAAFRFGQATARGLHALGFNLDLAPVVDLCAPDAANGIGDRSFGTDPTLVARVAGSFLDGLQQEGVAGCLKHFPGLGHTTADSHLERPTVSRDRRLLEEEDLLPYRLLGSRAAAVMVGHGHYPALDPEADLPASLSRPIVQGWLRKRLAFRGLVLSDDLEMGAVAPLDRDGSAAVEAVAVGCDLVPYCSDLDRARRARDALASAAMKEPAFGLRLEAAARGVVQTAARWPVRRPNLQSWVLARGAILEASALA